LDRESVLLLASAWQLHQIQFGTRIYDPWGIVGENCGRIRRRNMCYTSARMSWH